MQGTNQDRTKGKTIVKVQVPVFTNDVKDHALIYDQARSHTAMSYSADLIAAVRASKQGTHHGAKCFMYAYWRSNHWSIDPKAPLAPWQDW